MQALMMIAVLLLTSCSTGNINFSGIQGFWNSHEIQTGQEITNDMVADIHHEGTMILTDKQKAILNKAFDEGLSKGKTAFSKTEEGEKVNPTREDYKEKIRIYLEKNPKAKGCHPDMILIGAEAYSKYNEWTVFEGPRSLAKQKRNLEKGVTTTLKSKHVTHFYDPCMAKDILGKNPQGKFSHKAVDATGFAKGFIYSAYLDLDEKGLICLKWRNVRYWKTIRDAYHWEMLYTDKCKEKGKTVLLWYNRERREVTAWQNRNRLVIPNMPLWGDLGPSRLMLYSIGWGENEVRDLVRRRSARLRAEALAG